MRPGDTVARFGGDEFGIILDPVADAAEARAIAERLGAELRLPFALNGRDWFISASLGVAIAEPGRGTPDELLREAEIAMVRAKSDPTHRLAVFEPSMQRRDAWSGSTSRTTCAARIERGELRVHYQPIVDLGGPRLVGFEALVRWQHPTRGLVPPLAFIPLAEETGLIVPLGRWVLETACRQVARWRVGADARPTGARRCSCRSTSRPASSSRPTSSTTSPAILAADGPRPRRARARDHRERRDGPVGGGRPGAARAARARRPPGPRRLRDRLLVARVPQAPAARHDQDRPLVRGRHRRRCADRSIVEAVIALAHGLGIGVVAEGIETEAQADQLLELGCDLGQGYLFARPMPAADARRVPARERRRAGGRWPARPRNRATRPVRGESSSAGSSRRG